MDKRTGILKFWRAVVAASILCLAGSAGARETQGRTETAGPIPAYQAEFEAVQTRFAEAAQAGRTGEATALAEEGLRLAERAFGPNARVTLNYARYVADYYYEQGRQAEAAPLYVRAITGAAPAIVSGGDDIDTLNSVHNLALIYHGLGRHAEAAPLFERAIRANEQWMGKNHSDTLRLYSELVVNGLKDRTAASRTLEAARYLAAAIRDRRGTMASPGLVQASATRQLGNSSVALFANLGLANVRTGRNRANDLDAFVLLAESTWAAAAQRPADRPGLQAEAYAALQDTIGGPAGKAVEQMAARVLAERKASGLGALVRRRQALDDRLVENADASARRYDQMMSNTPRPLPTMEEAMAQMMRDAELGAEAQRNEMEMARIDERLRAEFPDYFTISSNRALQIAETQKLLAPDEAILLAVQSKYGVQVVAVSKSAAKWSRTAWTSEEVVGAVRRLLWDVGADVGIDVATSARWEAQGGAGYPFDRKTAHALYRQLITPVESVLAGKRHVFIAAGGVLSSLPFGILVTEPPQGADGDPRALRATKWFADAHALAAIPTIQSLKFLREAADPATRRNDPAGDAFAGYGDPSLSGLAQNRGARSGKATAVRSLFQTELSRTGGGVANLAELRLLARLPGTATELENMRVALGAPTAAVRVQGRATEAAIRSDDLSHVRILALATHGVMAGELTAAAEPGLVFTPPGQASDQDDGFLTASEVAGLRLDADWVILSACNTAAGDGSEGAPGLSGLARAFFYAGARNLLVSHWPVRDDVASRLTVDAIKRQQANPRLSRGEALQQAMKAIRNDASHDTARDSWAHPNAWAPFSMIGDGAK